MNDTVARSNAQLSRRTVLRLGLGVVGSAAVGAVLTACGTGSDDGGPALFDGDAVGDDADLEALFDEWLEHYEPVEITDLDVERLEVELQGETYEVWAYENTWVGEVTEDVFIAVSITDRDATGAGEVAAYACDSDEVSVYLTGDLVDDEATLDDCVDKIRFVLNNDEIAGTLTLQGSDPVPFVARPATGDAGLYRTETIEVGEIGFTPRWVVLPDGRQRGGRKCRNPWTGDCMWCPVPK